MNISEEWKEFLYKLLSNAVNEHKKSPEYIYLKQRQEQIDEILSTNLTSDQLVIIEQILFEIDYAAERENEVVYCRGLKDGVWILKNLGVLA